MFSCALRLSVPVVAFNSPCRCFRSLSTLSLPRPNTATSGRLLKAISGAPSLLGTGSITSSKICNVRSILRPAPRSCTRSVSTNIISQASTPPIDDPIILKKTVKKLSASQKRLAKKSRESTITIKSKDKKKPNNATLTPPAAAAAPPPPPPPITSAVPLSKPVLRSQVTRKKSSDSQNTVETVAKLSHKSRIQPKMRKQHAGQLRRQPAAKSTTQPPHTAESLSVTLQILCEALEEAHVKRVRHVPPVFVAQTYEQAEMAMQLFTEYYRAIKGSPGPVGFDTETTTAFFSRKKYSPSLIQIASQDICLIFPVYRITKQNTDRKLFPPRLKKFLEDPKQLKVGVAAKNDAKELQSAYRVSSAGIINLEDMAAENNVLAVSLAELDAMFGCPGREVIKTKALLKWNWDLENLKSEWTWYAAKDAFAGVAIFHNMRANKLKAEYRPYEQRFPMTESQVVEDVFAFLVKAIGKGKPIQLSTIEGKVILSYVRFQRIYQPCDRAPVIRKYIELLIERGLMIRKSGKESKPIGPDDMVDPSAIPAVHVSEFGKDEDQDVADLRLFLELSSLWDRPTTKRTCISVYAAERACTENRALKGTDALEVMADQDTATKVMEEFLARLVNRKVLTMQKSTLIINPEIEKKCFQLVPPVVPQPLPAKRTSDADMLIPDATLAASSEASEMGTTSSMTIGDESRSGSGSTCSALVAAVPDTSASLVPFVKKARLSEE
ncbi:hypothetical protein BG011_006660 [Mortierella polycephala]|uniref:3'-5' exonuclease domain-containing protein n=1 Tax=Mortierella polycephala TaxID=41804 RepID=A0A9P6U939_9FUNG|nr:hypothetical protein BG011_006660 [Mortierella polycephala]